MTIFVELLYTPVFLAFLAALALAYALILFRPAIDRVMRQRSDHLAVQASHVGDPLRLGGVAVVAGLALAVVVFPALRAAGGMILLAMVPVLLAGLAEDLGYRISAMGRFVAALISAMLVIVMTGMWVSRIDVAPVDAAMAFAPLAILMTVVFAGGFAHALNLIDGMNGLAGLNVLLSALGLAVVAAHAGLDGTAALAMVLAAAMAGFLPVNWPFGRVFLGDAGAYGAGHLVVWIAVSITVAAPQVAVPALLLVLFWPMADTVHTMARRLASGDSILQPDRMHLHQKIRRGIEIVWLGPRRRAWSNPLTTVVMAPMMAAPVVAGVMLADSPALAWVVLLAASLLFAATHVIIASAAGRRRRGRIAAVPGADTAREVPGAGTAAPSATGPGAALVSPLSRGGEVNGAAIDFRIFRQQDDQMWMVETAAQGRGAVRWTNRFASDRAAWDACQREIRLRRRDGRRANTATQTAPAAPAS